MRIVAVLYMLLIATVSNAQVINGVIIDSVTNKPVPFAVVGMKGSVQHTLTDTLGYFEMQSRGTEYDDTLLVYCMGYYHTSFIVNAENKNRRLRITVAPQLFEITGAVIDGMKPITVIKKMIEKLGDARKAKQVAAFYRQLHLENENAVRLIEADVNLFWTENGSEKVQINQMRRSEDYEKNELQHGDHLFDLLFVLRLM